MKFLTCINDVFGYDPNKEICYVFSEETVSFSVCPVCNSTNADPYETKTEGIIFHCPDCNFLGVGMRPINYCSKEDAIKLHPGLEERIISEPEGYYFTVCNLAFVTSIIDSCVTFSSVPGECDTPSTVEMFDEHGVELNSYNLMSFDGIKSDGDFFDYYYLDNNGTIYEIPD